MTDSAHQRVRDLINLGRYDDALGLIGPLVAEAPNDPQLHRLRGWALLGRDDGIGAAKSAERSLGLDPECADGHVLRALGLLADDFSEFAVGPARRATRLDPHNPQGFVALAIAQSNLGRHHEAWRAAETALELAPNESDLHTVMGDVAAAYPSPDYAVECYRRAIALDPHNAVALNNLAAMGHMRSGGRSAIRQFVAALAADPRLPEARQNLDLISIRMILWIRNACLVALVIALACSPVGIRWLGPALVAMLVAVGLLIWSRLPLTFRRSRGIGLRSGFGHRAATLVNMGVALVSVIACCLVALIPPGQPPPYGLVSLGMVGLMWGLNAWTAQQLNEVR